VVRNNLINQNANNADPNLTAYMFWLIWIYIVCPCHKGVYIEERVKADYLLDKMGVQLNTCVALSYSVKIKHPNIKRGITPSNATMI
jgi:hypothetical protein